MKQMLQKLLPSFIPLLVYIICDSFLGEKISLIVAIAFGIIEYLYFLIKDKKHDFYVLLDTFLLVLMGGISILLNNDIFFKLKPAIIEILFAIILGISIYTPKNIIQKMTLRYIKDENLLKQQETYFLQSLKVMFFIFLFHSLLIIYSAYFLSKNAWAFISGGFLYIIFGIYFLFNIILLKLGKKEKFAIFDENLNPIGYSNKLENQYTYIRIRIIFYYSNLFSVKEINNIFYPPIDTILPYNKNVEQFVEEILLPFPKLYYKKMIEYKLQNFYTFFYLVKIDNMEWYKKAGFKFVEKNYPYLDPLLKEELKHIT